MIYNKIFYIKNNGQVYECFENKKKNIVDKDTFYREFSYNREDGIEYVTEDQVESMRKISHLFSNTNPIQEAISFYRDYGIIV